MSDRGSEGLGPDRNSEVTESDARVVRLPGELRALGRSLDRPGADGDETMVERVLRQIIAEGVPAPGARAAGGR